MHYHPSGGWPGTTPTAADPRVVRPFGEPADDADAPDSSGFLGPEAGIMRVRGQVVVSGDVSGGASLGWGASLEVGGDFRGPAHLSPRSTLRVQGLFDADRVGRDGLVVVAGRCSLETARTPGTVVEPGAVLHDDEGGRWRVAVDGHLRRVDPYALHEQPGWRGSRLLLRWSARKQRFVLAEAGS